MQQPDHVRRGMETKRLKQDAVFAQQEKIAMQLITKAAQQGLECPSNERLAGAMNMGSVSTPVNVLKRLEAKGVIEVSRGRKSRVVRIVDSGLQTAGEWKADAKPVLKGPARKRMTRKDRFAQALSECGDISFAGRMIGVARDTARRLFDEICADLGPQAK